MTTMPTIQTTIAEMTSRLRWGDAIFAWHDGKPRVVDREGYIAWPTDDELCRARRWWVIVGA